MTNIAGTIRGVRSAGVERRATREFQQWLWEQNRIAAVGQGRISVAAALDNSGFRRWLAERSMERLPPLEEQSRLLSSFYDDLQSRLEPFVRARMPHLKIFRVIAALYPEAMTTIADRGKLGDLTRAMGGRVSGSVERHLWVRARVDSVLGDTPLDPEGLAARICIPWAVYDHYVRSRESRDGKPAPDL